MSNSKFPINKFYIISKLKPVFNTFCTFLDDNSVISVAGLAVTSKDLTGIVELSRSLPARVCLYIQLFHIQSAMEITYLSCIVVLFSCCWHLGEVYSYHIQQGYKYKKWEEPPISWHQICCIVVQAFSQVWAFKIPRLISFPQRSSWLSWKGRCNGTTFQSLLFSIWSRQQTMGWCVFRLLDEEDNCTWLQHSGPDWFWNGRTSKPLYSYDPLPFETYRTGTEYWWRCWGGDW